MTQFRIPFHKPWLSGKELDYIRESLNNRQLGGDGSFTRRCSDFLAGITGAGKVLLTTSCTHALEMAALLLDVQPGDEIILPSFAYVSAANAFVLRGAKPIFCEVRPDTLNLDVNRFEELISPRTKAVVLIHYAGIACEMDAIHKITQKHRLILIEDNALGLFGKYQGKPLGSFGALGALSFHETKSFISGEGGALLINEEIFFGSAEIIREKGTDRTQFLNGKVDKYTWTALGSSYLPSDVLAAILLAQLEAADEILERRKNIWEHYAENLGSWASDHGVQLPHIPDSCEHPYHMFFMLCPSAEKRDRMMAFLNKRGIQSVFHYQPLHLSSMGRKFGYSEGDLPTTESACECLLRLPFFTEMTTQEQQEVCEAVKEGGAGW